MPQFSYTRITADGREEHGVLEAESERVAASRLRRDGAVVTKLTVAQNAAPSSFLHGKLFGVPLKEKVLFAVNLSVMVSSGLPLSRALQNLLAQTRNRTARAIIRDLHAQVLRGTSLADAMARHSAMFNDLFVNMVRVGEVGGNLDESLTIVARQLEKEQQLRSRVRGAMMYPAIVLIAMVGVATLMLTYILPQIMGVFEGMDVTLPRSTQVIVAMSEFLRSHTLSVFGGGAMAIVAFALWLRTAAGRRALSWFTVHAPIVRSMAVAVNCARFARIHSSLLRSGVGVVASLRIVRDTLRNTLYRDALTRAMHTVERGGSLADVLREYPHLFPVLVPQMIDVGEETGKTDAMLMKIAGFYEAHVDQMTKNMSSIIEPLLMLVIGGGVGFFAIAMLKPMYSVMENIR